MNNSICDDVCTVTWFGGTNPHPNTRKLSLLWLCKRKTQMFYAYIHLFLHNMPNSHTPSSIQNSEANIIALPSSVTTATGLGAFPSSIQTSGIPTTVKWLVDPVLLTRLYPMLFIVSNFMISWVSLHDVCVTSCDPVWSNNVWGHQCRVCLSASIYIYYSLVPRPFPRFSM